MARQWIRIPQRAGVHSRQAHCDLPQEAPFEREMGKAGFFGPTAHFHHRHPPTAWTQWEGPLQPHALDLTLCSDHSNNPWEAPIILHNAHCQMRWWQLPESMPALARNADGDQLLFLHHGEAELYCDWGHLRLSSGDYLVLPRGSMWRLEVNAPIAVLMVEARNEAFGLPDRGLLGPQALFDPAVLDCPQMDAAFVAQQTETPTQVWIKRQDALSTVGFDFNPLDAVGWHGDLCAVRLNWRDIRPVMSPRYHLPPSAHTTFVSARFVVCTFVPRPMESDPGALKVPFFHNNDDFDEVLFYHAGNFFSRDNIHPGMLTWHPAGFTHGPHPKALANAADLGADAKTDEVAVMIDTRDPLQAGEATAHLEQADYLYSWGMPRT